MFLHEFLDTVPEGFDGLTIFVETEDETVLFLVVDHVLERIVMNIAEQLNAWFDSPVPFVVHHERLSEEEARFESAHVSVTDGITVDDFLLCHVFSDLSCFFLINPRWKRPVIFLDLAVMCLSGCQRCCDSNEFITEWFVVEKHPIVVIILVESVFDLTNGSCYFPRI